MDLTNSTMRDTSTIRPEALAWEVAYISLCAASQRNNSGARVITEE